LISCLPIVQTAISQANKLLSLSRPCCISPYHLIPSYWTSHCRRRRFVNLPVTLCLRYRSLFLCHPISSHAPLLTRLVSTPSMNIIDCDPARVLVASLVFLHCFCSVVVCLCFFRRICILSASRTMHTIPQNASPTPPFAIALAQYHASRIHARSLETTCTLNVAFQNTRRVYALLLELCSIQ